MLLNQETASKFYSMIEFSSEQIRSNWVENLLSYKLNTFFSFFSLEDHDYWDHFVTPTPWLFGELGFIPPTPVGEVFATFSATLRKYSTSTWYWRETDEIYVFILNSDNFLDGLKNTEEIDRKEFKRWAVKVGLFWCSYRGDLPSNSEDN